MKFLLTHLITLLDTAPVQTAQGSDIMLNIVSIIFALALIVVLVVFFYRAIKKARKGRRRR